MAAAVITSDQVDQLIAGVDRIADAFERIAAALEKANELELEEPERTQQQMLQVLEKLPALLGGIAGGFGGVPFRSDAIVELVAADPLAAERAKLEPQLPAAPVGPDGT